MKVLLYAFAAVAVCSLSACAVTPAPTTPSAVTTVEALSSTSGFDAAFYRAFVQNGFEAPERLEPIRILNGPLRIYLRTEDDAGRAIDATTLSTTERALMDTASIWSGETFSVTEIARGAGTREKIPGWITVKWSTTMAPDRCGRSTVGVDGGYLELNISGACSCGMPTKVYPRVVRHELGHAMGYYHTDDRRDVMYGQTITTDACDVLPSERERRHAKFAHSAQ